MMYVCSGEPIKYKIKAVVPPPEVAEEQREEPVSIEKPISALTCSLSEPSKISELEEKL